MLLVGGCGWYIHVTVVAQVIPAKSPHHKTIHIIRQAAIARAIGSREGGMGDGMMGMNGMVNTGNNMGTNMGPNMAGMAMGNMGSMAMGSIGMNPRTMHGMGPMGHQQQWSNGGYDGYH